LEREFDAWREPPVERSDDKSLSLMSEGELEIHLAGQHTTELLDHQFLHPLEQLDERLQALAAALGVEGMRANPVRPEAAVAAFVDLFGAEDLTRGLRPLVFNQFDKRLPEVLGDLYEKLNEMLEEAGFGFQSGSRTRGTSGRPASAAPASPAPATARAPADGAGWVPDGGLVEHSDAGGSGGDGSHAAGGVGAGPAPGGAVGMGVPAGSVAGGPIANDAIHAAAAEGRPPRYRDVVREQLAHWRAAGAAEADTAAPAEAGSDARVLRTEDLLNVA